MCKQCGCVVFIEEGPESVLKRVINIIAEMGVTVENVQCFEDGERICGFIAARVASSDDEEVKEIAEWVAELHESLYAERSRTYAKVAREVFANFPQSFSPKEVITEWHQLEQLCRELGDGLVVSMDEGIRDVIRAVQHVHDNPRQRRLELMKRHRIADL